MITWELGCARRIGGLLAGGLRGVSCGGILVYVLVRSISVTFAGLALGFAGGWLATYDFASANARVPVTRADIAAVGTNTPTNHTKRVDRPVAQAPQGGMRLASLEPGVPSSLFLDGDPLVPTTARDSFGDRFSGSALPPGSISVDAAEAEDDATGAFPAAPDAGAPPVPRPAIARSAPKPAAPATTTSAVANAANAAKKRMIRLADVSKDPSSLLTPESRTAIYDITARKVYMPNGRQLEAHSGLGDHMDDVRYISLKGQGPTPPNVYDLTMREELFHGVRAIRLNPVDDGKMFGRDGILAHTYMLGPNGQSNGCISFNDYNAFLNAFLKGEVDRIVVVEHLENAPPAEAWGWVPDSIKNFFGRS
jgi:hypothetical protein